MQRRGMLAELGYLLSESDHISQLLIIDSSDTRKS